MSDPQKTEIQLSREATPVIPVGPLRLDFIAWMSRQPPWVHVLAVVATALFGYFTRGLTTPPAPAPTPAPVVNVSYPPPAEAAPRVMQGGTPVVVEGRFRLNAGQRLFGHNIRHKLSLELQAHGFAAVGGDPTPFPRDKAEALVRHLSDEVIVSGYAEQRGQDGLYGGPVIDWLREALQWVRDHPEEVRAFIKLLLTILMFF